MQCKNSYINCDNVLGMNHEAISQTKCYQIILDSLKRDKADDITPMNYISNKIVANRVILYL